jgi:hypothetical protein
MLLQGGLTNSLSALAADDTGWMWDFGEDRQFVSMFLTSVLVILLVVTKYLTFLKIS